MNEQDRAEIQLLRTWVALTEGMEELAAATNKVLWVNNWERDQVIYTTRNYEQIWGRPLRDLLADPVEWVAGIHDDHRDRVGQGFAQGAAAGEFNEVYTVTTADGATMRIRDRGYPVADESGNAYRIVGIAECIADDAEQPATADAEGEDRAEFQMLRAWVALSDAMDHIAHADNKVLWVTDWPEGQTIYATHNYDALWAQPLSGLLSAGHHWTDAIHDDHCGAVRDAWSTGAASGGFDEVYILPLADGTQHYVRDRGYPVHNEAGEVFRIVGIAEKVA